MGVEAKRLIPFVDKREHGWQVKQCDPSSTRAILSALEVGSHEKALYKCPVFNFFFFSLFFFFAAKLYGSTPMAISVLSGD